MYHTDSPAHGRRPGRLQRWLLVLAAAAACNAMIGPAAGQEPERGVAVLDRPRPDYDPIGIRAGAFLVFPSIEPGLRYDGKHLPGQGRQDVGPDHLPSPRGPRVSQWSNHELVLGAGAASDQYFTYTDESKLDWFTTVAGRVDFTRATKLHAALDLYDLQEEPDDPRRRPPVPRATIRGGARAPEPPTA